MEWLQRLSINQMTHLNSVNNAISEMLAGIHKQHWTKFDAITGEDNTEMHEARAKLNQIAKGDK